MGNMVRCECAVSNVLTRTEWGIPSRPQGSGVQTSLTPATLPGSLSFAPPTPVTHTGSRSHFNCRGARCLRPYCTEDITCDTLPTHSELDGESPQSLGFRCPDVKGFCVRLMVDAPIVTPNLAIETGRGVKSTR